jgi:SdrD B-like domain
MQLWHSECSAHRHEARDPKEQKMSQQGQQELKGKTQQLLDGPLKHIRGAALAAALLPLASVAVAPASAQTVTQCSGGICGTVFNDANNNGSFDGIESGIEGVKVFVCQLCNGTDTIQVETGPTGQYSVGVADGTYTVYILIPPGKQASPPNAVSDLFDSDGIPDGKGFSVVTGVTVVSLTGPAIDFGLAPSAARNPGTGTPGYWKNHPEAWPVNTITVGGKDYTKAQAIYWLGRVGTDKTTTMFAALVSAMLSVMIGNDDSCIASTITAANAWMATYGPVGNNVPASSPAWVIGEPLQKQLDSYNNGLLCAPHRQ